MRTDTQSTVEYWMDQAKNNLNAADDFKAELKVARREIRKLEMERDKFHEDADAFLDKMSKYQERSIDAERKLASERELADCLAEAAKAVIDQWETPNWRLRESTATYMNALRNTITAWKEARDGSR